MNRPAIDLSANGRANDATRCLLDRRFPRTLDALLDRFERKEAAGAVFQAWTFDDAAARRDAERRLSAVGVEARLRSAYKPLVHFLLEEVDRRGLRIVHVRYPVRPAAAPNRFRLEAYPLAALAGEATVSFEPDETLGLSYAVRLAWRNGTEAEHRVFAPNRAHADPAGTPLLSPTGWLHAGSGEPDAGERMPTDIEMLFQAAIEAVEAQDWSGNGPFFGELNLAATLPFAETALAVGSEVLSLEEALHEDLYFSLLDHFARKAGLAAGSRHVTPGQIVPEILFAAGDPSLRIETRPCSTLDPEGWSGAIEEAEAPVSAATVARELAAIGGEPFEARSRAGRIVAGRHRRGSDLAVMISGGQHANEPSGIVGALRAAKALAKRREAHFTVAPLENPDGQALHLRLCRDNPGHMHHAARYTAFGDDLEHRATPFAEREIRVEAERRTGALLHVNLHGYPAHEWTRPLSGYVPSSFAAWTLPKGFFLILHHHVGWEGAARELIDRVTRRLAAVPGLVGLNERQLALCRVHSGEPGFDLVNDFPCLVCLNARHAAPLTLITEHPDETIRGDAFRLAHAAQTEAALAAYDALQAMRATLPIA